MPNSEKETIKILLADDMAHFLDLEISFLRRADCHIITAENGIEALKLAKTERPDIILLDIEMPRMTGIECCRHIKNDPALKHIPVIMVTATTREEESRKAGADAFWRKPLREDDFLLGIKQYVPIRERLERRISIGIQVDYKKGGRKVSAFTKDISNNGMFIITRDTLPVGNDVELTFSLPEENNSLTVRGRVVRELRDDQNGHYVGGMGVNFLDLDEEACRAINHFITDSTQPV
jgi:uncharacterized protein (TIGR02266 family)